MVVINYFLKFSLVIKHGQFLVQKGDAPACWCFIMINFDFTMISGRWQQTDEK